MSSSIVSKPSSKAWYFKAGESKVKLIDYKSDDLQTLLECRMVDCQSIYTSKGIFTIFYNDNGIYEDTVFNKPASQVLGKLPIMWGTMNGNFIVKCSMESSDEEEDNINIDMPTIGFKEWITLCSDVMRESQKRQAERMKADGYKEVYNKGGFSVSFA